LKRARAVALIEGRRRGSVYTLCGSAITRSPKSAVLAKQNRTKMFWCQSGRFCRPCTKLANVIRCGHDYRTTEGDRAEPGVQRARERIGAAQPGAGNGGWTDRPEACPVALRLRLDGRRAGSEGAPMPRKKTRKSEQKGLTQKLFSCNYRS
jgi:hypothetical protein